MSEPIKGPVIIGLVAIEWSESERFSDGDVLMLDEFERIARSVARDAGRGNGYRKTKVRAHIEGPHVPPLATVTFRVDLAEDDDHGIASVVRCYQRWLATPEGRAEYERFPQGRPFWDIMREIVFP